MGLKESNNANPDGSRVYQIDPLSDPRWTEFVRNHPRACVFHTSDWLRVLQTTYQYKPVAFTLSAPGELLQNALLFCDVKTWLTRRRMVSLPFSDHCEPLVSDESEYGALLEAPLREVQQGVMSYVEVRPETSSYSEGKESNPEEYFLHKLDLSPTIETIYKNLHVDSIRRKIQKGEREKLQVESGSSEKLLAEFYQLHVITRRRQLVPPHPLRWFQGVLKCMGERAKIRVARKDQQPVSAVLTIEDEKSMIYKYGCSDSRFHNLGAMPFVFWNMVQDAKARGLHFIDLGRSNLDNPGLISFKDRWGAAKQRLIYARFPARKGSNPDNSLRIRTAKFIFGYCPESVLTAAGNFLYPHIG